MIKMIQTVQIHISCSLIWDQVKGRGRVELL